MPARSSGLWPWNGRTCPATGCASAGSSIAAASPRGPLATLDARLDLKARATGCQGVYRLAATPRGLVGRASLAGGFLSTGRAHVRTLAAQADRFACGARGCRSRHRRRRRRRRASPAGRSREQLDDAPTATVSADPLPRRWPRRWSRCRADPAAGAGAAVGGAGAAGGRGVPAGRPARACSTCAGICCARAAAAPRPPPPRWIGFRPGRTAAPATSTMGGTSRAMSS